MALIDGFPSSLEGSMVFCHQDNINTDGIYPGKYTYRDDVKIDEMAKVAMENYDIQFTTIAQKGDILVAGFNFGTGSSREQAATCLKHKGLPVLIAGSLNSTYVRNAFNNGLLVVESPSLVDWLKKQKDATNALTVRQGKVKVDFQRWEVQLQWSGKNVGPFALRPVGEAAQELIVVGGLEEWIVAQTKKQ
eukprot:TRINITY_DN36622_c0_g1_i2.p1 TRINITY_DN36622_c0_g1~~TRINITY_DN36622_c0_g1_i2.p1  ORF type:complete len:207 (+),score=36.63 TRINITY_DN36622_c0_g1_i2:51-623(+)